jgi:hypothetical protein
LRFGASPDARASFACSSVSDSYNVDVENNTAGYYFGVGAVTNSVIKNNKAGSSIWVSETDTSITVESNEADYTIGVYNAGALRQRDVLRACAAL